MSGNGKSSGGCVRGCLGCLGSTAFWVILSAVLLYLLIVQNHASMAIVNRLIGPTARTSGSASSDTSGFKLSDLFKGFKMPSISSAPQTSASCNAYANDYSSANAKKYAPVACQDAVDAGIDPRTFVRQINQESGFDPQSGSSAGARGIAQFMPATAAGMNIDVNDPYASLKGGARLMAGYVHNYGGDMAKALGAYNCGSGCVQSAVRRGGANWQAYTPAETQNYIRNILG